MNNDKDAPAPEPPPVYKADLTKGMEHIRSYVSVPLRTKQTPEKQQASSQVPQTEEPPTYGVPSSALPTTKATSTAFIPDQPSSSSAPTQHSTDIDTTSNPNHRADPDKFGSRYLGEEDDIFAFNAWDDVPLTDTFLSFAEEQYAFQRSNPVSTFDAARFNLAPHKWWDKFYANNSANFFKDRRWLFKEFPVLRDICAASAGEVQVLEVGCGAGNTAFPLMKECENPKLVLHCCDFSKQAIEIVKQSEMFDSRSMRAEVWDVAANGEAQDARNKGDEVAGVDCELINLPPGVERNSIDLVILVFVFSALSPSQWHQALRNLEAVLKPGGEILFRDYGRGDLAQVRFKRGRWLQENFYVRGDGTRVYFFDEHELGYIFAGSKSDDVGTSNEAKDMSKALAGRPAFERLDLKTDRRMLVNRQRRLKMYRCWIQGRFRKSCLDNP